MGSIGANRNGVNRNGGSGEVPAEYRLRGGEDARTYFENGSYAKSYSVEQFVRDSRNVDLYGGIDFARSSGYENQEQIYKQSVKRWRKQINYWRQNRAGE